MPKLRRKSTVCYNCETQLLNGENYCPNCGQENHSKQASTRLLIKDFVDTYLSFDSKLFISMRPLLFQPGKLTQEYLDGKRVRFVPPIRLFIFLSFLYFGVSYIMGGDNGFNISLNNNDLTGQSELGEIFQRNINLMILLFTPLHALVVMIFFRSKERSFYVNFFVFTLHLFSFFFTLGILIRLIFLPISIGIEDSLISDIVVLIIQIVLLVYIAWYSIIALKRTFNKKYTILRYAGTVVLALILFLFSFVAYLFVLVQFVPLENA
ncbi:MAG: DUF3667 domain-containing protein [Fluviicola sp.]